MRDSLYVPLGHELAPPGVHDELGRERVAHEAEVAEAADAVADLAQQLGQVRQTVLVQAAKIMSNSHSWKRFREFIFCYSFGFTSCAS